MLDPHATRPPIATAPLSVLLLAEGNAPEAATLAAWRQYLESLQRPYEILLVQPQTNADAAPEPNVFAYDPATGWRSAVRSALAVIQHPLVVLCTGDAQYQPADLGRLLRAIDPVDLVCGYRALPTPFWRRPLDLLQRLLARLLLGSMPEPRRTWLGRQARRRRWVARWIFGLRAADPECPYRVIRREVLARIPLQSRGPFVHVELLAKANHLGCPWVEEPVSWSPPTVVTAETFRFRDEAYALFRRPDFGPPPAPSAPPAISSEPAADASGPDMPQQQIMNQEPGA
jgi:hypothetical protein